MLPAALLRRVRGCSIYGAPRPKDARWWRDTDARRPHDRAVPRAPSARQGRRVPSSGAVVSGHRAAGPPLWRAPSPLGHGVQRRSVACESMPYAAHPWGTGRCPDATELGRSSPWQPRITPTRSANASWPRSARPKRSASASKRGGNDAPTPAQPDNAAPAPAPDSDPSS